MICEICGNEVGEDEIIFIEVDWGICSNCAKDLTEDIEKEKHDCERISQVS